MPLFFERRGLRVVTADPWAFLKHLASERKKAEAARLHAYIDQAGDFFAAAENPRTGSKPLLYYYSFLNLAKVALRLRGVNLPAKLMHGIFDPAANNRERVRLQGQSVRSDPLAHDHSKVFPEFCASLGINAAGARTMKVVDVLAQVASIHRTFISVSNRAALLMPLLRVEAFSDDDEVWLRVALSRTDEDVRRTLPTAGKRREFRRHLAAIRSHNEDEHWFQSVAVKGRRRGVETALGALAERLYEIPFTAILTGQGYRYYICDVGRRSWLHPLVAIHAAMFYLGSVTRYKPEVFGKILGSGYAWAVEELLATAPTQFLYMLCSSLAGIEVVRPFAVRPQ